MSKLHAITKGTVLIAMLGFVLTLTGCSINNIPTYKQQVDATWSQVMNEYQRRTDLIPNLVETAKGYVKHERETLENITKARSSAMQAQGSAHWP